MEKAGLPTPAVNQIELNPYWHLEEIVNYCKERGIALMGYCPIFQGQKNDDPILIEMASRYKKTVPQLLIRWSVQKNYITIPKSTKPERILENANVFDFTISDKEMRTLVGLLHLRVCITQGSVHVVSQGLLLRCYPPSIIPLDIQASEV